MTIWCSGGGEIADSVHVALVQRIACFTETPGLSGLGCFGLEWRKLLVMAEEVMSFSLCELCWHYVELVKQKRRSEMVWSVVMMLTYRLVAEQPGQPRGWSSSLLFSCSGNDRMKSWRVKHVWPCVSFNDTLLCTELCIYTRCVYFSWTELQRDLTSVFFSSGHSVCVHIELEQFEDDFRGCGISQILNPQERKRWGTQPPSSARLSSVGMSCWPASCTRATCSSKTLWIPIPHMENPTNTTLRCTTLPDTPWLVYSGQDTTQTESK